MPMKAGLHVPHPPPKQRPECDVLTELKAKTLALEARRKDLDGLQRDILDAQKAFEGNLQQTSCLEADIL